MQLTAEQIEHLRERAKQQSARKVNLDLTSHFVGAQEPVADIELYKVLFAPAKTYAEIYKAMRDIAIATKLEQVAPSPSKSKK
jgi:hypothetical protein